MEDVGEHTQQLVLLYEEGLLFQAVTITLTHITSPLTTKVAHSPLNCVHVLFRRAGEK